MPYPLTEACPLSIALEPIGPLVFKKLVHDQPPRRRKDGRSEDSVCQTIRPAPGNIEPHLMAFIFRTGMHGLQAGRPRVHFITWVEVAVLKSKISKIRQLQKVVKDRVWKAQKFLHMEFVPQAE